MLSSAFLSPGVCVCARAYVRVWEREREQISALREERRLWVTENRMLNSVLGQGGRSSRMHNEELHGVYVGLSSYIVRMIRWRDIEWKGKETRIGRKVSSYRVSAEDHFEDHGIDWRTIFFLSGATAQRYQGRLILEVSGSHSDTSYSAGLLWATDRSLAEISTQSAGNCLAVVATVRFSRMALFHGVC